MKFRIREDRIKKPTRFGVLVESILERFNLSEEFLVEAVRAKWPSVVGELIATHSFPDRIQSGVLYIAVDHNVYAGEISMMREASLESVSSECSVAGLRDLRVLVRRDVFAARPSHVGNGRGKV